jgi:hypothetical protein
MSRGTRQPRNVLAIAAGSRNVQRGLFRDCHGPGGVRVQLRVYIALDRRRSLAGLTRDYRAMVRAKD